VYTSAAGDRWASGFIPDVNGDGFYDVIVRAAPDHGSSGLYCVSGKDGTQIWSNPSVSRGGVSVGDVTGDGVADFAVANCCYDDTFYILSGADGNIVPGWPKSFGSFDLMGVKRIPGTHDMIVAAQGSADGGIRRYQATDGALVWPSSSTYNDNTIPGLIPTPTGYYVLSGWRHQGKVICLDAATGNKVWDDVPAAGADDPGIVIPDRDGDGFSDLLIMNNGSVALYSTATGTKISDLTALTDVVDLALLPAGIIDSDNDGVPDGDDLCPDTPAGDIVNADGCSIAQLVPCIRPTCNCVWKNHGQYVSAVAAAAEEFLNDGLITEAQKDTVIRVAAKSRCGRK
jgi:hypothetical protein